jgi:spore coat polysaccharide biosynthesis predicted glycosyltransferase SpsG
MDHMDIMFNRTRYIHDRYKDLTCKKYLGIDYTIIQSSCRRIETRVYRENLQRPVPAIAISMGGGDAANKTLRFLNALRNCEIKATFWVLLGEGYNHSYDSLMQALDNDRKHEIILAKTNRSMWQILSNCLLAILPGGITTYEAAFAGLPTINFFDKEDQYFLVRELVESSFCINAGLMTESNLQSLNGIIENLLHQRELLLKMHEISKGTIDGKGCERIIDSLEKNLGTR